jgi:hypothetical protein
MKSKITATARRAGVLVHRFVRHFQVVGKRGTFVCARGLTNKCVITGIIYDSPFHKELAYRINYMPADSDRWVDGAEISTDIFMPNKGN